MKHSLYLLIVLALLFNNMCSEQPLLKQSDSGAYTQVTSLNTADAEIEAEQKWYQPDKVKYATIIASATATAVYMCNPTLRSLSWLKSAGLALLAYAEDVNARRGGGGFGSSSRRSGSRGFSSSSRRSGGSALRKSIKSHTGSRSSSFSKKAKSTHKSGGSTSKKSIKSRTASKSNLLSKIAKPANDNVLTLKLEKGDRSKIGGESKIRSLQRAAREGKLVVTKDPPRNSAITKKAREKYAKEYPKLDMSKVDMDHRRDLQLGGTDTLRNIAPLDRGLNRKIGAQISQEIKSHNYSVGTPINRVRVISSKAKPANDNTAREGKLIVTKNSSRSSALTDKIEKTYTEKYPRQNTSNIDWLRKQDLQLGDRDATRNIDWLRKQDLQLGGKDTMRNIAPLDSSFNRSFGAQIQQAIKDMPVGTIIRVPYNYLDE